MSVTFLPGKGWILTEPLHIRIDEGWLHIPAGFRCDLASVPCVVAWIPGLHCYSFGIPAPTAHDAIYRGIVGRGNGLNLNRRRADRLFYNLARDTGVGKVRARVAWCALRAFGGLAWRRLPRREESLRLAD